MSELFYKKSFYILLIVIGSLPIFPQLVNGWNLAPHFADDAYYYLIIARNFVELGFFTFDGINETNGFHPLWLHILVIMYKVIGTDSSLSLQIFSVKLIESLFYLGAIILSVIFAFRLHRQNHPLKYLWFGLFITLLNPYYNPLFFQGMETTLTAFFLIAVLQAVITNHILIFTVLSPLLFLSRLDTLIFVIFPCWLLLMSRHKLRNERIILTVPLALTVLMYIFINYLHFGYLKPISGILKSSFPWVTFHFSYLLDPILYAFKTHDYFSIFIFPNIVILLLLLVSSVFMLRWKHRGAETPLIQILIIISALLILNLLLFQKWNKEIESWYLVLPSVIIMSLCIYSLSGLFNNKNYLKFAFLLIVLSCTHLYIKKTFETPNHGPNLLIEDIINFIKAEIPENDVLAATDGGIIAFFAERRYVNLDGLVNSYDYQKFIKDKKLLDFLKSNNVSYLLVLVWAGKPPYQLRDEEYMYQHCVNKKALYSNTYELEYYVYSYMYNVFSEKIKLSSEQEVYRSPIFQNGLNDARVLIFDLRE